MLSNRWAELSAYGMQIIWDSFSLGGRGLISCCNESFKDVTKEVCEISSLEESVVLAEEAAWRIRIKHEQCQVLLI